MITNKQLRLSARLMLPCFAGLKFAFAMVISLRAIAMMVQRTALAAGLRPGLPESERRALFAGHSLRVGLATSAEIDERHVQKQLGHATAEMTRRCQRNRDRFRVSLALLYKSLVGFIS
ncbi:hypothetical protein SAMN04489858_1172 [Paracoccus homiensis]|uniref:Phage integrase family protein n=1 Tax=Paracoccus homiensis TaxID=364199 RepID=A0A1I0IJ88_9RHOB|nr:hypothetical protein SAMN04489858_1172 [Paracoccus homiensis]